MPENLSPEALIRYAEQVAGVPRTAVEPLRRLVEEQRVLAEQLAMTAERLRQLAEEGAAVIEPLLAYAERVSDITGGWVEFLRRGTGR
ncbi:MAG TPA: hypothetical protein VGO87_08705 [Acidimicrobiia bacterium]|jgi:methyl-accepting chemotaxis protein